MSGLFIMEAENLGARFFALEFPVDWISKFISTHSVVVAEVRDIEYGNYQHKT